MATPFKVNPERVAYFEAAGWRAYYDHKWIKMLRLITGALPGAVWHTFSVVAACGVLHNTCISGMGSR